VNANYVFEALRAHMRARGMTYEDLASAVKLSTSAVKKMFAKGDCTLSRLDQICAVVQVDLAEIARGAPRQPPDQ